MADWLHNLPIVWMTLLVFGFTYLLAAGICGLVTALAEGERARAFMAISRNAAALGIIFGLFVAFTAAQVWTDNERANAAVDREASALRAVVVLAAAFPGEPESRLRALIRRHIEQAATQEWPMMARGTATLRFTPPLLAEALR
jgi:ABC-type anion transport system duplicated permease subunit